MARIWYTKNYCVQFCKSKTCFGPVNPRPMKPSPSLMAMVATIYQRATRSWCGASPTCWTTSSLMCGPYLKLSTYPPQVPNCKMGVRSILPQPPPPSNIGGGGGGRGECSRRKLCRTDSVEVDQPPHPPPSPVVHCV